MVYFKMSMEIQLINQIEKYEFLYNFNLPEYNRKDLVEEAWTDIAASQNLSVSDCKEKWRNIRSSFLRSMRHSASKVKKPYYLTEYLKFILPYLKPINIENTDEEHNEAQLNHGTEVMIDYIKEEPVEFGHSDPLDENHADNGILNDLLTRRPPVLRKRRRFVPAIKKSLVDLNKNKGRIPMTFPRNDVPNSSNSAMKMFLMSLLPELESMTEDQVRLFKIKSMTLIDDIKANYEQMRAATTSTNSDRLQKRLINLLLKSLQRNISNDK